MQNVIRYLGEDANGLRNKGLYPVVGFSDRGLPKVLSDDLYCTEVSEYEYPEEELKCDFDTVEHPFHYASGSIECIDAMKAAFGDTFVRNFCIGNAFKYLWRCNKKGHTSEDIRKCKKYLEIYLESVYGKEEEN